MSSVTPGRETDAAVALALGWSRVDETGCGWHVPKSQAKIFDLYPAGHWFSVPPAFSTSPADAIAALEATGKHYTISKDDDCYHVQIWRDEEHQAQGDKFCDGTTLCTAICAAILAWADSKKGT